MLMSNEFVMAEANYRRELLRDLYRTERAGRVGKGIAVLVVAGALLLAACGTPTESNRGVGEVNTEVIAEQRSAGDVTFVPLGEEKTLEEEFSGVPAPSWSPRSLSQAEPTAQPSGHR